MTLRSVLTRVGMIALLVSGCVPPEGRAHRLALHVTVNQGELRITYENMSNAPVMLGGISLSDPALTGTYVELSDAATGRKLGLPSTMTYYAPDDIARLKRLRRIGPGERITSSLAIDEVFEAYLVPPESCVDLVAYYSRRVEGEIVSSAPSPSIRICGR